uniref:Uncharacterized protein n=1 Tax=Physcomitrium patens TaxID=3218 RepID=A0A2K1K7N2_PHYPA|nr:hypothetical protein PHYPA_011673 [Physcomitrium patens]
MLCSGSKLSSFLVIVFSHFLPSSCSIIADVIFWWLVKDMLSAACVCQHHNHQLPLSLLFPLSRYGYYCVFFY